MKRPTYLAPLLFACLYLAPIFTQTMLAQTSIGGDTCKSSSLNGNYSFTITGRQVGSTGSYAGVFQANGFVNFDGLSKASFTLTADTLQAAGTSLPWSGSYSIQANCAGTLTITTGGTASFSLVVYNQGNGFLLTGSDSLYSYTASGNTQPASCLTNLLSGVYTVNATGLGVTSAAVSGVANMTGLLQFDGNGNVVANLSVASVGAALNTLTLTGTYSVTSNCLGSATLTDSKSNSYSMTISVSGSSKVYTNTIDVLLVQPTSWIVSGAAHAIFGQPTASISHPIRETPPGATILGQSGVRA